MSGIVIDAAALEQMTPAQLRAMLIELDAIIAAQRSLLERSRGELGRNALELKAARLKIDALTHAAAVLKRWINRARNSDRDVVIGGPWNP